MNKSMKSSLDRYWRAVEPPKPEGTNPTEAAPFPPSHIDRVQRVACARRSECLSHALKASWDAWTCAQCVVNQPVVLHAELGRVGSPFIS